MEEIVMENILRIEDKSRIARVKKYFQVLGFVLTLLIVAAGTLVSRTIFWAGSTWSELSIDEIIYHLKAPLEGTGNGMILQFILVCVCVAALAVVAVAFLLKLVKGRKNLYLAVEAAAVAASLFATQRAVVYAWDKLDISTYRASKSTYSSFIDDNYVEPGSVDLAFPEEKRNLIYIYLESMEITYADKASGGAFEENYIPSLTQLAMENETFSGDESVLNGGYAMNNTTWTMGAMFGHSVGLPLTIPIDGSDMDSQESFFPGITGIGDILEEAGYQNALLIGSKAVFGGRELFFQEHGDYAIYDYTYSQEVGEIPEDYYVWWGYEDKKLFENAKKHLLELSQSDQPFNLTMLTVDTHFEDGYYCEDCQDLYDGNRYANVITCSDSKVTELIHWIQQQDFYDNTTIVVTGDHPTMDKDFCDPVAKDYTRKVYTTYINAPLEPKQNTYREYATFDLFPTTLAALNVEIEGDRLGLGTNLYSDLPTLTEKYGRETENEEILKKSELMDKLSAEVNPNSLKLSEQQKMLQAQKEYLQAKAEAEARALRVDVSVTPYDYRVGYFSVDVSGITEEDNVQAIRCAVWSEEDQSDLIWCEASRLEDGTYRTNVYARDFGYWEDTYQIHVYAIRSDGTQEVICITEGAIT